MFNRSGEFWMCLTPKGKNDILALGSHAVSEGLLTGHCLCGSSVSLEGSDKIANLYCLLNTQCKVTVFFPVLWDGEA